MADSPLPVHDIHSDARTRIDQDINRLTEQIRALRSARNELAPISRLPMELLRNIFLLTRNSTRSPAGGVSLTLSWVSRKWREFALGIPHLWSTIDLTVPSWIETCLTRSRNVPLDISMECSQFDHEAMGLVFFPMILAALPRIRSLELDADDETERVEALELWNSPAPELDSLALRGVSLPPTVFNGAFPSLSSLELSHCNFHLDPFPSSDSLVELTLSQPDNPLSLSDVFEILKSAPNLAELDLCETIDEFGTTPSPAKTPFSLSSLHKLSFTMHPSDITLSFFQHITFPQDVTLEVNAFSESSSHDLTVIHAVVASGQLSRRPYQALKVATSPGFFSFLLDDRTADFDGYQMINLSFDAALVTLPAVFRCLEPLLPALSNIETLVLDDLTGYDQPLPHFDTFGRLENLRSLRLNAEFFPIFLQYVASTSPPTSGNPAETENFIPFPVLSTLTLDEIQDISPDQRKSFCAWLQERVEQSRRLPKLVFFRIQMKPTKVEAWNLGNVVGEVVFEPQRNGVPSVSSSDTSARMPFDPDL